MSLAAVRSGDLRHRITIERATETVDALGDVVRTWPGTVLGVRWGRVVPLRGQEFWDAQRVNSKVTHKVTLRDITGLTTSDRFVHLGRTLNLEVQLDPEERHITREFLCTEETQP